MSGTPRWYGDKAQQSDTPQEIMMGVKAWELAYVRVQVPNLDEAEKFFNLFGLPTRLRTDDRLYLRGTGPEHHLLVAHQGDRRILSIAFELSSEAMLKKASMLKGASAIEPIEGPGGGQRVTIEDLDGNTIELVYGLERTEPIIVPHQTFNSAIDRSRRRNTPVRPEHGPAHVMRLGHVVMRTPSVKRLTAWYQRTLGLLESDEVVLPDGSDLLMSFIRLDQGDRLVDHHVFQLLAGAPNILHHISFEVQDIDDLHVGHFTLKEAGYRHMWGVGRHLQGSQIFDYWLDPFGTMYEHWTDSDVFTADVQKTVLQVEDIHHSPWGPPMPQDFLEQGTR